VIRKVDDFGLKFAVVLEDRFSDGIDDAQANVGYLRQNPNPGAYPDYPGYFENPAYIRLGAAADPLLMSFGPITFQQPAQWTQILAEAGEDVSYLTLWYESHEAGANADGEYAWIYEDAVQDHMAHQSNYYRFRAPNLNVAGGAAYPGFNDFYAEGGVGDIIPFEIPHENGQTLDSLLDLASTYSTRIDFLQLATFNDFGEGTMFEPTLETGFEYLKKIQAFTGTPYGDAELELVYRLYIARKRYAGNGPRQASLDEVADLLSALEIAQATNLLDSVAPHGDFDGDGDVDADDYGVWRRKFGSKTVLVGSGADGNYDGTVDAADYSVWRKSFNSRGGAGWTGPAVPEPAANVLVGLAAATFYCRHVIHRTRAGQPCSAALSRDVQITPSWAGVGRRAALR
jgi:hypothetical protein